MTDAVDYSWSRPDPAGLAAAGVKLACRYLSHDTTKNITAGEVQALHSVGIGVLANWESDPGRPLFGAAAGAQDGADAAQLAMQIGIPAGCAIYPSCDTDTNSTQWPTIGAYYRAFKTALGGRYRMGAYGEADLIDYLHGEGLLDAAWQTLAWSNGRVTPNADLYQCQINQTLAGGAVDFNQIIHADRLGAWWPVDSPHSAPIAPAPTPIPILEDDEMLIIVSTAGGQPHLVMTQGIVTKGPQTSSEVNAKKIGALVWAVDPVDYAKYEAMAK